MEMTEEEIVKKYSNNPQAKTINILADLNGVQAYEIKRILGKAGVYEPKHGRPRKTAPEKTLEKIEELETGKTTKSEEPLKPKVNEAIHKDDSLLEKKPIQEVIVEPIKQYMVPEVVKELIQEEFDRISARMIEICDEADRLNARREELKAFLKGE